MLTESFQLPRGRPNAMYVGDTSDSKTYRKSAVHSRYMQSVPGTCTLEISELLNHHIYLNQDNVLSHIQGRCYG